MTATNLNVRLGRHDGHGRVSQWETGQALPSLRSVVLIGEILGVSLDWLLRGKEESGAAGSARGLRGDR